MKKRLLLLKQNKGVTLIELIVAMALLSIVSVTIIAFLTLGVNQYRSQTEDIAIQRETQMMQTQLRDILSDANRRVYVADVNIKDEDGDIINKELLDRFERNGETADSVLVILNSDLVYDEPNAISPSRLIMSSQKYLLSAYFVTFFKGNGTNGGQVYYNELLETGKEYTAEELEKSILKQMLDDNTGFSTNNCQSWPCLAEHVGSLSFDIIMDPDQDNHRNEIDRVDTTMQIVLGNRTHSVEQSVALRNRVYRFPFEMTDTNNEGNNGTQDPST